MINGWECREIFRNGLFIRKINAIFLFLWWKWRRLCRCAFNRDGRKVCIRMRRWRFRYSNQFMCDHWSLIPHHIRLQNTQNTEMVRHTYQRRCRWIFIRHLLIVATLLTMPPYNAQCTHWIRFDWTLNSLKRVSLIMIEGSNRNTLVYCIVCSSIAFNDIKWIFRSIYQSLMYSKKMSFKQQSLC